MNRRDVLAAAGSAAVAAFVAPAMAADHSHHGAAASPNAGLITTALDCIRAGNACIAHCFESFAAGDTSLAACAKTANQMLSVCATLQTLASAGSARLPEMAKVAMLMCQDCEKECRKHADIHPTCKACAEACAACAEECRKVA